MGKLIFATLSLLALMCSNLLAQSKEQSLNEDVGQYRPKFNQVAEKVVEPIAPQPFVATVDVTRQLNARLDSIANKNKRFKYAQGYRILVYTGASSEEVAKVKEQVVALVPSESVYNVYKQPTFRIKVGDYFDRVEAGGTLGTLKKDFPNAILIPDQIVILKEKSSDK